MVEKQHKKRALLILEMALDHQTLDIVPLIAGELQYFRERERLVIFACAGGQMPMPLTPRPHEIVLSKSAPSAFYQTDLETILRKEAIARLTLVGLESHTSILLTAADAMARGYEVTVPETCIASFSPQYHFIALQLIREQWAKPRELSVC